MSMMVIGTGIVNGKRVMTMDNVLQCMRCHRHSNESDCNNLQCPFCGGNMVETDQHTKRTERNRKARESRKARHEAMIACGLTRVRVNGRVSYE